MIQITPVVRILIIINITIFLITNIIKFDLGWLALHYPDNPQYGLWQYATSIFMHSSFPHILLNMFGLYMFGSALEKAWGGQRFLFIYFIAGIGAGIIYNLVNYFQFTMEFDSLLAMGLADYQIQNFLETGQLSNQYVNLNMEKLRNFFLTFHTELVGASGAIYGILVAFTMRYPNTKLFLLFIPFPVAVKFFVPALLLLDLFLGMKGIRLFGSNIAHFAHLGGALVGLLLVLYWREIK